MSLSIFLILSLHWRLEGYLLAYWDVAIAKQVSHTSVPMGRQQELMVEKVCEISDKISRFENLSLSKQVPKRIPFVGSGPLPVTSIILRLIIQGLVTSIAMTQTPQKIPKP
ncbi:hypothetical protein D5086_020159 [Populus alba]|uniref:Uncharacterized protein n=2 Tax=Populus alba TaxID=43335 RepID=A0A4U5QV46_POPAL|nr:hypothetical protein D5086_0000036510 [Populus alba]